MIEKIKLKHLDLFTSDTADHAAIMKEVIGLKGNKINKLIKFRKAFKEANELFHKVSEIDISKTEPPKDYDIKLPKNIDDIPFIARMELESITTKMDQGDLTDNIASVVAIACFNSNYKIDFNVDLRVFNSFRKEILNRPLIEIIGLFNWIKKDIKRSNELWEKKFREVDPTDPDYIQAGGQMLSRFNVINTIKAICEEFNVSYHKAWHIPYIVVQTNSLANASEAYVQNKMTKIKERRMKQQRGM